MLENSTSIYRPESIKQIMDVCTEENLIQKLIEYQDDFTEFKVQRRLKKAEKFVKLLAFAYHYQELSKDVLSKNTEKLTSERFKCHLRELDDIWKFYKKYYVNRSAVLGNKFKAK